jgi:hypothetical protein
MPFELGVAYALAHQRTGFKRHRFFVLEERPFRIDASLSDLKGFDPYMHEATQQGILAVLLDCFGSKTCPELDRLEALTAKLAAAVDRLQRKRGASDPFQPDTFRRAVSLGTAFARAANLIR